VRIERFFHIRPTIIAGQSVFPANGGATVRVVYDTDGDGQCSVQVTHCSQKDGFSRKTGRETAGLKYVARMHIDELPKKLNRVSREVLKRTKWLSKSERVGHELWTYNWGYVTKYFRPKATNPTHGGGSGGAPIALTPRIEAAVPALMQ
jgi:hypothetical protein